ncbi:MAG: DUF3302 domain-containing protein [Cycloclasticus sp.]|nr:DUF3302 domain-containing protein [Cycloclasticus sp.]
MLDGIALGILCFSVVVVFYGIIVIHDIPYEIAKHRNHPHSDAIHVAGWISLLTLHILWPFLWIWSTLYREDRGWGFSSEIHVKNQITELEQQVSELSTRLATFEQSITPADRQSPPEIKTPTEGPSGIVSESESPNSNPENK